MDPAIVSAVAALTGSFIGASASVLTSWLSQRSQYSSQQRIAGRTRRETLYAEFIDEASRLYADAITAERPEPSQLVRLLALVNRIELYADEATVKAAGQVAERIIETYYSPPLSFDQLASFDREEAVNPLREFSGSARAELDRMS